jgi:hypothetical protein
MAWSKQPILLGETGCQMTLEGHVEGGHVVLDGPLKLPDGTRVTVLVQSSNESASAEANLPTLYERLKPVAGKAKGLPADLAINHDHYLHGQPKRQ